MESFQPTQFTHRGYLFTLNPNYGSLNDPYYDIRRI